MAYDYEGNYDDYDDYYGEDHIYDVLDEHEDVETDESFWDEEEPWEGWESLDGDTESGLASAGWGTDEDYGYYAEGEDD